MACPQMIVPRAHAKCRQHNEEEQCTKLRGSSLHSGQRHGFRHVCEHDHLRNQSSRKAVVEVLPLAVAATALRKSMPVEQLPNRFYAPEGRYALYSERQSGLQYFSSSRATRLTFVEPLAKEEGLHVVFNVQDLLHICNYSQTGKVRFLIVNVTGTLEPVAQCSVDVKVGKGRPRAQRRLVFLQPPRRSVLFAGGANGGSTMPTCHDYYPASDGYDLLVGFGTGDGQNLFLHAAVTSC